MSRAVAAVALMALAGCGAKSVCDGTSELCIALHVEGAGALTQIDQLALSLGGALDGPRRVTPGTADARTLPVDVALLLPRGTRGELAITVEALLHGAPVGVGMQSLTLDSDGPFTRTVALRSSLTPDADGGGAQDLGGGAGDGGQDGGGVTIGCPPVMVILDRSASMSVAVPGSTKNRLTVAKEGILEALRRHSNRFPYGLTTFESSDQNNCFAGIDQLIAPKIGSETQFGQILPGIVEDGASNVGEAVESVFLNGAMRDPRRKMGHIVLITDGSSNCDPLEYLGDGSFATRARVQAVARAGMKVHVLAPGLDSQFIRDVDVYAAVGGAPCSGALCGGHSAWPAGSAQDVTDMLDAILAKIEAESAGCIATLPITTPCASAPSSNGCASIDVCCPTGGCQASCASDHFDLGTGLGTVDGSYVDPYDFGLTDFAPARD